MPFYLTNAPATFNRMMDKIFRNHRSFTRVLFDNILVYSKNEKEHKAHLAIVFSMKTATFAQHKQKDYLDAVHFLFSYMHRTTLLWANILNSNKMHKNMNYRTVVHFLKHDISLTGLC